MNLTIKYLAILLWLLLIYLIGLYWFAKGFLLTRLVVNETSSCDVNFTMKADHPESQGCWMHKSYDKAIIIIIDALRFDFALYNKSLHPDNELPFQNKLKVIGQTLAEKPLNSRLYKFVADPPTTTLQRLKGLTAGSLPTFIDASQNFASTEINEDNIIDQLRRMNKEIVFMGDDTWLGLYPDRFKRTYDFPSFNVKDLHTVDNGVLKHLQPELRGRDWDVLIAHFLGVDHCGHRYGPYHPEMAAKLTQMDQTIREVMKTMEEDTILFVMGDHGMTRTGDHGGDSQSELDAALFIYSPAQITASNPQKAKFPEVSQVDFVPTFSLLLGIPVPFANLGMLIPDLFNHCPHWNTDQNKIKQIYHSIKALRLNAHQIQSYLKAYSQSSSEFPYVQYAELELQFHDCEVYLQEIVTLLQLEGDDRDLRPKLQELRVNYKKYLRGAREMCQSIWAKFDSSCLLLGVLTIGTAVLMQAYLLMNTNDQPTVPLQMVAGVIGSVWLVIFLGYLHHVGLNPVGLVASLCLGCPAIIISTMIVCRYIGSSSTGDKEENQSPDSDYDAPFSALKNWDEADLFASVCLILYGGSMFSNSYVVYEDRVSVFLLFSVILVMYFKASIYLNRMQKPIEMGVPGCSTKQQLPKKFDIVRVMTSSRGLLCLLIVILGGLLKLQAMYRACREEQWTCDPPSLLQPLSAISDHLITYKNIRYFYSVGCIAVTLITILWWLRHHGNMNGYAPMVLLAKYALPASAAAVCFYWAVQGLPKHVAVPAWPMTVLPVIVYITVGLTLLLAFLFPLMIYIVVTVKSNKLSVPVGASQENILPHVYRQVKENWQQHLGSERQAYDPDRKPLTVYGLATVYSSPVITMVLAVSLLLALLLGDGMSGSVALQLAAIFIFLEIHSAFLFIKGKGDIVEDIPWCSCVVWGFLTSQFFFSSGHQATFPNIRWEAAFTGFQGDFENYIIPVTLITLNTFAAQILSTFSLPLLLLWPLVRGRNVFMFEGRYSDVMQKGEFVLNEQPTRFRSAITRLVMAQIFFHGFKLFCATFAAAIHRRHLMVWKIFAPHFVFESATCGLVIVFSIILYFMLIQIDNAVSHWVQKLPRI